METVEADKYNYFPYLLPYFLLYVLVKTVSNYCHNLVFKPYRKVFYGNFLSK